MIASSIKICQHVKISSHAASQFGSPPRGRKSSAQREMGRGGGKGGKLREAKLVEASWPILGIPPSSYLTVFSNDLKGHLTKCFNLRTDSAISGWSVNKVIDIFCLRLWFSLHDFFSTFKLMAAIMIAGGQSFLRLTLGRLGKEKLFLKSFSPNNIGAKISAIG